MQKWFQMNRNLFFPRCIKYRSFVNPPDNKSTLYDILQVTPAASQKQIKAAYYKLSFIWHPDKNKGSSEAHEKFAELTEAYKVLSDPTSKKSYDISSRVVNPVNPGPFHSTVIQRHSAASAAKHDTWTKSHYQHQLALRDDRIRRDRIHKSTSEEERQSMQLRSFTILLIMGAATLIQINRILKKDKSVGRWE